MPERPRRIRRCAVGLDRVEVEPGRDYSVTVEPCRALHTDGTFTLKTVVFDASVFGRVSLRSVSVREEGRLSHREIPAPGLETVRGCYVPESLTVKPGQSLELVVRNVSDTGCAVQAGLLGDVEVSE